MYLDSYLREDSIKCVVCKLNFHRKCISISRNQFKDSFTGEKGKSFVCETCNVQIRNATEHFASQINNDDDGSPDLLVYYFEDYALPNPIRVQVNT